MVQDAISRDIMRMKYITPMTWQKPQSLEMLNWHCIAANSALQIRTMHSKMAMFRMARHWSMILQLEKTAPIQNTNIRRK